MIHQSINCMSKLLFTVLLLVSFTSSGQYRIQSKSMSGKKVITTTKYDPGYVVMKNGTKKSGDISLKVVNTDTVEIRMKTANGKTKYARSDIQSFGLDKMKATGTDLAGIQREEPVKNLQPGYVILANGDKIEGKVAMRNTADGAYQAWKKHYAVFEKQDGTGAKYMAEELLKTAQMIQGKEVVHHSYKGLLLLEMGSGGLVYTRHPFPTIENRMASMAVSQTANQAVYDAENDLREKGAEVESSGAAVGAIYFKEYMAKKSGDTEWTIFNKKNYSELGPVFFKGCGMDEKMMRKWGKVKEALDHYASKCGR